MVILSYYKLYNVLSPLVEIEAIPLEMFILFLRIIRYITFSGKVNLFAVVVILEITGIVCGKGCFVLSEFRVV